MRHQSRSVTSPTAKARMMSDAACEPLLPPDEMTSGTKSASDDRPRDLLLEVAHRGRREHLAQEQHDQPARTLLHERAERRLAVRLVQRLETTDPLDVGGDFVFDHVDHVVYGDRADQLVLRIDDRDREQVIRGDLSRHLLLIVVHVHADHVGRRDPLERRLRRNEEQPAERDHANQVAPLVHDVDVEDHLHAARFLERVDRIARGRLLGQREHLRIHDPAGGAFGVIEEFAHGSAVAAHQLAHTPREFLRQ